MQRGILRSCALFAVAVFCVHTGVFRAIAQQPQQTREGIYPKDLLGFGTGSCAVWLIYVEPQSVSCDLRQGNLAPLARRRGPTV